MVLRCHPTGQYAPNMGNRGESLQSATAAEIRAEMAALDLDKQQLAGRIGVSHQSVGRYLRGERDIPFPILVDIADALNLDVRELLRRAYARIGLDDVQ